MSLLFIISSATRSCPTLCNPVDWAHQTPVHVILQENTGVGCHFLLWGIFPTQQLNPHLLCLLHWQADSLPTSATWEALYCCCCLSIVSCVCVCVCVLIVVYSLLNEIYKNLKSLCWACWLQRCEHFLPGHLIL